MMATTSSMARSFNQQPTVKCSTCEADVELAQLADHRCTTSGNAITPMPLMAEPGDMDDSQMANVPRRGASLYQRRRPTLPKLDPNAPGKFGRELDPREAANIAHDLGLPSPISAGPGRRSPRPLLPRKGSSPRIPLAPPSPELPISQDCAFPPFPTNKLKRTMTAKESRGPKLQPTSRSNTHDATLSNSTSSSLFSSSSGGPGKSRISDTSSDQRSRKGTLTAASSPPSTAPSSPRRSSEYLREGDKPADMYAPNNYETNDASFTPPLSAANPHTFNGDALHAEPPYSHHDTKDEFDFVQDVSTHHDQQPLSDVGSNAEVTFDTMLPASFEGGGPDRQHEPMYKLKRPPPLEDISMIPPERQFAAINSRAPAAPMTGGLGRTFTNLFSRKRSQSLSSKKAPKFDVNSPRMKALAPEAPPVPLVAVGEYASPQDDADSYFSQQVRPSPTLSIASHDAVSPLSTSEQTTDSSDTVPRNRQVVSPLGTTNQPHPPTEDTEGAEVPGAPDGDDFDFKFGDEQKKKPSRRIDTMMIQTDFEHALSSIAPPPNPQPEISLQRASIDSASSYGSVQFSQHTISTRSSPPPSDELRSKISNALRASTASVDLPDHSRSSAHDRQSDHQTDTTSSNRRLSPVMESGPSSPDKGELSPGSDVLSHDWESRYPNTRRPSAFAANKGTCRGCSQTIELGQKSVSSKDGRLSGRYHKGCFGCQTCKQPFVTADFYVFDDHPYCGHHYHVLNNTLCTSCGNGIEGQYFETTDVAGHEPKKFHPSCLVCATCRMQLKDDYFEFQGHVYCERDAFRAANGPIRGVHGSAPSRPSPLNREYLSSGEPMTKGRFPERRTTRLMMT